MTEPRSDGLRRRRFLAAATALGAGALAATAAGRAVAEPLGPAADLAVPSILPPGDWVKLPGKSDEFAGQTWDRAKWATDHWNPGGGGVVFDERRVAVYGGKLHIEVRRPAGDPERNPWPAGLIHSVFTIGGDSYLEVRARMIPFAARINSAIWVQQEAGPRPNPNVEIDLQEYHLGNDQAGRQNIRSSIHLWNYTDDGPPHEDMTPNRGQTYATGVNLDENFHMYGLERRGGQVNFYFDGTKYRSLSPGLLEQHPEFLTQERPLILACNGLAPGYPAAEGDMVVDHVRTFAAR